MLAKFTGLYALMFLIATSGFAESGQQESLYDEKCIDSQLTKLGAQKMVNADLAIDFVKVSYSNLPITRIGVVDSGLDPKTSSAFVSKPELIPTYDSFFDLLSGNKKFIDDDINHGTPVSGLINGKWGVGVNPWSQVISLKSNRKDAMNGIDSLKAAKQIIQACDQGVEILNASFGSDLDLINAGDAISGFKTKGTSLYRYLIDRGCLLVQAAGNLNLEMNNISKDDQRLRSEQNMKVNPVLRVGGVDRFGTRSKDLSAGEINAPAENVFSFTTSRYPPAEACFGPGFGLYTGTSFASPIIAGIAGLTMSILKTSPNFLKLKGEFRVYALKHILKKASQRGYIDAYFAVRLADQLVRHREKTLALVENLEQRTQGRFFTSLLEELEASSRNLGYKECTEISGSDFNNLTARFLRETISLCPPHFESEKTLRLFEAYKSRTLKENKLEEHFQIWNRAIALAQKSNPTRNEDLSSFASNNEDLMNSLSSPILRSKDRLTFYLAFRNSSGQQRNHQIETVLQKDLEGITLKQSLSDDDLNFIKLLDTFDLLSAEQTHNLFLLSSSKGWPQEVVLAIVSLKNAMAEDRINGLKALLVEANLNADSLVKAAMKRDWSLRGEKAKALRTTIDLINKGQMLKVLFSANSELTVAEIRFIEDLSRSEDAKRALLDNLAVSILCKRGYTPSTLDHWFEAVNAKLDKRWVFEISNDSYVSTLTHFLKRSRLSTEQKKAFYPKVASNWFSPLSAFSLVESISEIDPQSKLIVLEQMVDHAYQLTNKTKKPDPQFGLLHVLHALTWDPDLQGELGSQLKAKISKTFPSVYSIFLLREKERRDPELQEKNKPVREI